MIFFSNKKAIKSKKNSLLFGSILIILISVTPFLMYLHTLIPTQKSIDTIFGTIGNGGFGSVQVFIYMVLSKFIPFFLLALLYITNKNWWSHVVLIPIASYLFQLISLLFTSSNQVDEIEFIYVIPILVIILVPLYFIRQNIVIYILATDLKKEMDDVLKKEK